MVTTGRFIFSVFKMKNLVRRLEALYKGASSDPTYSKNLLEQIRQLDKVDPSAESRSLLKDAERVIPGSMWYFRISTLFLFLTVIVTYLLYRGEG